MTAVLTRKPAGAALAVDLPDHLRMEIGDSTEPLFWPHLKVMKWGNECNVSLRLLGAEPTAGPAVDGDRIEWRGPDRKAVFYPYAIGHEEHPQGGVEFEVHFPARPASNVVAFSVRSKAVRFHYQGELSLDQKARGARRPENVIGSYAVYHATKEGHRLGGNNYRSGKVGHIYRPHARDASGRQVWCEFNSDLEETGILTVTVPQEFLDTAIYPVVIDPTLGYTTIGASEDNTGADVIFACNAAQTDGSGGTMSKIQACVYDAGGNSAVKMAVYPNTGGTPPASGASPSGQSLVTNSGSGAVTVTRTTMPTQDSHWTSSTSPTGTLSASTYYWLCYSAADGTIFMAFDGVAEDYSALFKTAQSYASFPPATFPSSLSQTPAKYGVYATYAASTQDVTINGSGGMVMSGSAAIAQDRSQAGSGGAVMSGSAAVLQDRSHDGSGGAVMSGSAAIETVAGGVIADIQTNRITGVAPLFVFFDASATTAYGVTKPFHALHYSWDFDDPSAGNWSISGRNKNKAIGPLAGHVFETAGTYTVTLTVTDMDGNTDQDTVDITVDDADTVFSGTNTICISTSGDFTGAPSGSTHTTSSATSAINSAIATGKRVLLRRGESWTGGVTINVPGPFTLGSYGSGSTAKLTGPAGNNCISLSSDVLAGMDDCRIMDLELDGTGTSGTSGVSALGTTDEVLILRCNVHDYDIGLGYDLNVLNFNNESPSTDGHTIFNGVYAVDTTVDDAGLYNVFASGTQLVFMGCTISDVAAEHLIRTGYIGLGLIQHCATSGAIAGKHQLKLHAPDFSEAGLGLGLETDKVIVSDNTFSAAGEEWSVAIGPQNGSRDERVKNVIVERNKFLPSASASILCVIWAREVTVRNNWLVMTGMSSRLGIAISRRGVEPQSDNVRVVNNTYYNSDAGNVTMVEVDTCSNILVRNNLASAPSTGTETVVADGGGVTGLTEDHNNFIDDPDFVSPPSNLHIEATSTAIGNGVADAYALDDWDGFLREGTDQGADELGSLNDQTVSGSGDMVLSGSAAVLQDRSHAGSGDAVFSGSAAVLQDRSFAGSGDMVLSGSAAIEALGAVIVAGSGDMVMSGSAVVIQGRIHSGVGEMVIEGTGIEPELPEVAPVVGVMTATNCSSLVPRFSGIRRRR